MASIISNSATGSTLIDSLLASARWGDGAVTFGFTASSTQYGSAYGIGEAAKGYQPLSASQMSAVRDALASWGELINLKIVETTGADAELRIASSSAPTTAWAYTPGSSAEAGDVWFGTAKGYYSNPTDGNYAKLTFIHELGHALGLGHPHQSVFGAGGGNFVADSGADQALCPCCGGAVHGAPVHEGAQAATVHAGAAELASGNPAYFGADVSTSAVDAMAYSVMSYSSYVGDGHTGYTNGTWDYAQSPMVRDIAAIQSLYGANYATRGDDTVYSWNATTGEKIINGIGQGAPGGNKVFETIWDGGGRDTIDLSAYTSNLKIDLAPGGWIDFGNSQLANLGAGHSAPGNVAMSLLYEGDTRSLIENAVGGSGNDLIKGNAGDNFLIGGAGDDRIEGGDGNDILAGGTIGNELSFLGIDRSALIKVIPQINGADGNDILIGGNGNDLFIAGKGHDTVDGGNGIDTLIIDSALSAIQFVANGAELIFNYLGNTTTATNIEYLATQDGIFAIHGATLVGVSQQQWYEASA